MCIQSFQYFVSSVTDVFVMGILVLHLHLPQNNPIHAGPTPEHFGAKIFNGTPLLRQPMFSLICLVQRLVFIFLIDGSFVRALFDGITGYMYQAIHSVMLLLIHCRVYRCTGLVTSRMSLITSLAAARPQNAK